MSLFNTPPVKATYTLRVLAHLLRYPDAAFRAHIPELQQALKSEAALTPMRLAELGAIVLVGLLQHLHARCVSAVPRASPPSPA